MDENNFNFDHENQNTIVRRKLPHFSFLFIGAFNFFFEDQLLFVFYFFIYNFQFSGKIIYIFESLAFSLLIFRFHASGIYLTSQFNIQGMHSPPVESFALYESIWYYAYYQYMA